MRRLIDHARTFPSRCGGAGRELKEFEAYQRPSTMFITCSDSRVVPTLLTDSGPGELFEMRTAGNIVPPYDPDAPTSEMATIEYAVSVLEVSDIILCGHSHCGAVGALARGEDLRALPHGTRLARQMRPDGRSAGPRRVRPRLRTARTAPCGDAGWTPCATTRA